MIDPHWTVADLDPDTWRAIGRFFDVSEYVRTAQPGENALFVLHASGRPLSVYDSKRGSRPELVAGPIENPQLLAHNLFESGEWDRVHVIDRQHLRSVARQAQVIENRALTLDAYYHRVFQLMWHNPQGYVSLPPHPGHWRGWTYSHIQRFIRQLPDPASAALGVLDDDRLAIGVIVEVRGGLIRLATTFEALSPRPPLTLSAESFEQLWAALSAQFAPPGAALLCAHSVFEDLITSQSKLALLQQAAANGRAFWRVHPTRNPGNV